MKLKHVLYVIVGVAVLAAIGILYLASYFS